MISTSFISMAFAASSLLATGVAAAPQHKGYTSLQVHAPNNLLKRDDVCQTPYGSDTLCTVDIFSDDSCQNRIGGVEQRSANGNQSSGCANCSDGFFSPYAGQTIYLKMADSTPDSNVAYFTRDQTCPPDGPDKVLAVNRKDGSCTLIQKVQGGEGLSCFPHGGGILGRRDEPAAALPAAAVAKRDNKSCKSFVTEKQFETYTSSVSVSDTIDCTQSPSDCTISEGQQHTESTESSYSFTAGGGGTIEGLFSFSVESTFGQSYTTSDTTTIQYDVPVKSGQKGVLTASSRATAFDGHFTDCDDGSEPAGRVIAAHKNGLEYSVTYV